MTHEYRDMMARRGIFSFDQQRVELEAIHAGKRRLMVDLRCARPCGSWLGGVFDTPYGAVLYVEQATKPEQKSRATVAEWQLRILEFYDEAPTADGWHMRVDGVCRRHGAGMIDPDVVLGAVRRYRDSGRAPVVIVTPNGMLRSSSNE